MKRFLQISGKTLLALYLIAVHALALLFIYEKYSTRPLITFQEIETENVSVPTEPTVVPTIAPIPEYTTLPADQNTNQDILTPENTGKLMIPVVGVKREQLQDTYTQARSEERVHNAIDIPAPLGTPVVAVSDGEIAKFFDSEKGGITIYQYSPDRRYVYYYAHLQKRAENIKEGEFVKQGTVVGYVGDTGNAGAGNYHLHFDISILSDPTRYFEGTSINPYPLLKNGIEANP
ncbi:MAG TPA: M23 family metallopeptidase [Pyrinomonadaceae bacterium]|nr:M23 family metallopeptidase [Pyrinomonadaceae bacterium]